MERAPVYRLANWLSFIYDFRFRDRCRSGLSGTPGKRVLVKANRGFESLPVRTNVRTGKPTSGTRRKDGAGAGLRGSIARARSAQVHQSRGVTAKVSGRRGTNPERGLNHNFLRRVDDSSLPNAARRDVGPDQIHPFQINSTLLSMRGSRLWWTGQPRAADSRSFLWG